MKSGPILFIIFLLIQSAPILAAPITIKPFTSGSYQQILAEKTHQSFVLVIWSLDCSTCIKDMTLLSSVHKAHPKLNIVMLSTDELSSSTEIQKLLDKYQLSELESWVFADDNSQKLRYEIDPAWYSELPRTYFFSGAHQREGVSGALTAEDYQARINKMK